MSGPANVDPVGRLGPADRQRALNQLAREHFDVMVVGGGVTGCGAALDAVTRGLSVALIEKRDWAAGTSSRSGKLIHGGLRYLEQLKFGLVREALTERSLMLRRLCPHLVRPVPFLYPLEHRVWERAYVGAGTLLYDTMGGAGAVPRHRHLSRQGALRACPALRPGSLTGAISFHDAQVDDARHTVTLARTAAAYGAVLASSAEAAGLVREAGRVTGVRVRDVESGDEVTVRARHVIFATGVWTSQLQDLIGEQLSVEVRASKGVHLLVPRDRIRSTAAVLVRAEDSVLFIRPWGRFWLIGTTDTPWDFGLDHPAVSQRDVDYLLRNVNRIIQPAIGPGDITGAYAGLRPLLAAAGNSAGRTSQLSREHAVLSPLPGLTVVTGGKYTTYRIMAADAVDAAVAGLGRTVPPSCTAQIPLLGAAGWPAWQHATSRVARQTGLSEDTASRLLGRYGALVTDLAGIVADRPDLRRPIDGAEEYLLAEAYYAATHEGALHLDDVLTRRTHISIEAPDRGVTAAGDVAAAIAPVLGWTAAAVDAEVSAYHERVAAELDAARLPDDRSAALARAQAPDRRNLPVS